MTHRYASFGVSGLLALATLWSLAAPASACERPAARTASVAKKQACAAPAAKVTATLPAPLPEAGAPVATTAFPALPNFTQAAPARSGLIALIDPETGMLTGPIGDIGIPEDLQRSFAEPVNLTPVALPGGGVMIDLQGTMQEYYVLTIDPLGRRSIRCVSDPRKAASLVGPVVHPIAER